MSRRKLIEKATQPSAYCNFFLRIATKKEFMLAQIVSGALCGIEAFPVMIEVNAGMESRGRSW